MTGYLLNGILHQGVEMENSLPGEIWVKIDHYDKDIYVSNKQRLKYPTGRITKGTICRCKGYVMVTILKNGVYRSRRLHRLLAEAFIPNPDKKSFVNHKNGVKSDNRLENLEWVTHRENCIHAYQVLGRSTESINGEKNISSKLTKAQVIEIRASKLSLSQMAKKYGVSVACVGQVRARGSWKHI